jgi:hypothetical protein
MSATASQPKKRKTYPLRSEQVQGGLIACIRDPALLVLDTQRSKEAVLQASMSYIRKYSPNGREASIVKFVASQDKVEKLCSRCQRHDEYWYEASADICCVVAEGYEKKCLDDLCNHLEQEVPVSIRSSIELKRRCTSTVTIFMFVTWE